MKPIILYIFFLSNLHSSFSQDTIRLRASSLSVELGKNGLIYNLVFDHLIQNKHFGFRLGAGANFSKSLPTFTVGGGAYYLFGRKNKFFELGADVQYLTIDETSDDQKGAALVYPDYSINALYPSLNLGYRRYGRKTLLRIGFAPGIIDNKFIPGAYVSFGSTF